MPGFDRTGPMGMGPMTGGRRGRCNPYGRPYPWMGFGPWSGWGRGRGRGYRHAYWATGQPGWMRSGSVSPWVDPLPAPYTREQEMAFLKEQAAAMKEEMNAIDSRLQDLESRKEGAD